MNWLAKRNRVFLVALGVSILAHLLAVLAPGWRLPAGEERLPPLEAHLAPLPPPPKPAGKAEDLDRLVLGGKPAAKPRPEHKHAKVAEPTPSTGPSPKAADEAPPRQEEGEPGGEPTDKDQNEPDNQQAAATPPPNKAPGLTEGWADSGRVQYDVIRGESNFVIGRTTHAWKHDNHRYTMETVIETTGLVSLLKPFRMVQRSEGKVLPDGLQPEKFRVERDGQLKEKADFDWSSARVALVANGKERDVPIAEGDQDVLSLMHQLGLDPQGATKAELLVVTGKSASRSVIRNLGLEEIVVPAGRVSAYHLSSQGQRGELQIDIWLARDYGNLPVRIKITDRNGDILDQVATGVELSGMPSAKIH